MGSFCLLGQKGEGGQLDGADRGGLAVCWGRQGRVGSWLGQIGESGQFDGADRGGWAVCWGRQGGWAACWGRQGMVGSLLGQTGECGQLHSAGIRQHGTEQRTVKLEEGNRPMALHQLLQSHCVFQSGLLLLPLASRFPRDCFCLCLCINSISLPDTLPSPRF